MNWRGSCAATWARPDLTSYLRRCRTAHWYLPCATAAAEHACTVKRLYREAFAREAYAKKKGALYQRAVLTSRSSRRVASAAGSAAPDTSASLRGIRRKARSKS